MVQQHGQVDEGPAGMVGQMEEMQRLIEQLLQVGSQQLAQGQLRVQRQQTGMGRADGGAEVSVSWADMEEAERERGAAAADEHGQGSSSMGAATEPEGLAVLWVEHELAELAAREEGRQWGDGDEEVDDERGDAVWGRMWMGDDDEGEQQRVQVKSVWEQMGVDDDDVAGSSDGEGRSVWEQMRAEVVDEGHVGREREASGQQGGGWQVVGPRKQKGKQRGLGVERGVRKGAWDGWRGQGMGVTEGAALMERAQARRIWERRQQ